MKMRRLSTKDRGFEGKLKALTRYDATQDPTVQKAVRKILAEVRAHRRVAALAYVGEDLAHRLLHRWVLRGVVAREGL